MKLLSSLVLPLLTRLLRIAASLQAPRGRWSPAASARLVPIPIRTGQARRGRPDRR